jgi:hypothetical protein
MNMRSLSKIFSIGTIGALASVSVIMTGCNNFDSDSTPQNLPVAYVSIYNAIPDVGELDIIVDNRPLNSGPVSFGDNTYYRNFYTGTRNFKVSPFRAGNILVDTTVALADGNAYSIFMADEASRAQLIVTNDSAAVDEAGKGKIRLVNLSPDAAPLSVRIKGSGSEIINNQAFKEASLFVELEPGTYDFEIISADSMAPVAVSQVELPSASVRTIVVSGYRQPPAGNTHVIAAEIVRN